MKGHPVGDRPDDLQREVLNDPRGSRVDDDGVPHGPLPTEVQPNRVGDTGLLVAAHRQGEGLIGAQPNVGDVRQRNPCPQRRIS